MKDQLQSMSPKQKAQFLRDNAYKVEEGKYFKRYTEDELVDKKEEFSAKAIVLSDLEDEFTDLKKDYSQRVKDQKETQRHLLSRIRAKGEYAEGETYLFDDQENGVMITYDCNGNEVDRRKIRPEERQTSILTASK